jgi:hypothetical protein
MGLKMEGLWMYHSGLGLVLFEFHCICPLSGVQKIVSCRLKTRHMCKVGGWSSMQLKLTTLWEHKSNE